MSRAKLNAAVGNGEARRLAAIDVGTNSIRLIVAEAKPDGSYRLLDDEKEVSRLGQGLGKSGRLSAAAMRASTLVIGRMKGIAEGYGVESMRAVGTCAVREARNQKDFLELVRTHAGVELEVISAEEEGRLAFASVNHAFDLRAISSAVVDIGGGSTEVVLSSRGVIESIHTLPLGAVRLTERFLRSDGEEGYESMLDEIRSMIKRHIGKPVLYPQLLIGTGGTYTALAAVAALRGRSGSDADAVVNVRGYELQRSDLKHLLNWLRSMSDRARARVPGLSPERAEIIVAGAAIVDAMMRRLKVNTMRVHDRGIRDGILLGMIRQIFPAVERVIAQPQNRMETVKRFAESCHYEKAHSDHVTRLALQAFDQLKARLGKSSEHEGSWSDERSRELLEAAGYLHDVGYYINYAKHHKHSYHLIIHSELAGFTHRELEVIANIARYHRRARPKKSHPNFAALSAEDRDLVKRLAAILRIVDGLDRAHAQAIQNVSVVVDDKHATFVVAAPVEPVVDIWGAERKCEMFEKVFGLTPKFRWAKSQDREDSAPTPAAALAQAAPLLT